jgi:hypothetical protein
MLIRFPVAAAALAPLPWRGVPGSANREPPNLPAVEVTPMPVRVLCPGCRKKLAIPDHLAGKTLRCPSCQTPFRVPSGDGAGTAPAPSAGGNPFDFAGGTTAPAGPNPLDFGGGDTAPAGPATFDFVGGGAPAEGGGQHPVAGQVQGLGWRLVRRGIGLAQLGFILFLVAGLLAVTAGGVLALSVWLQVTQPDASAGVWACRIVAGILGFFAVLLGGIGLLLGLIGQLLCCAVPQGVASRLCIWGSVGLMLVGFLVGGIGSALGMSGSAGKPTVTTTGPTADMPLPAGEPGTGDDQAQLLGRALAQVLPYVLAAAVSLSVAGGGGLVAWLLWLLFLRQVAWLLGNQRLARGVVVYVVYLIVWPLLLSCAGGITGLVVWAVPQTATPTTLPWLVGVPSALAGLLVLVNMLWYFILLRRTAVTLKQAVAVV